VVPFETDVKSSLEGSHGDRRHIHSDVATGSVHHAIGRNRDRRVRVSDVVYEQIRSEIIEWDLKPGASLGEIETAERVGVSHAGARGFRTARRRGPRGHLRAHGARRAAVAPARHRVLRAARGARDRERAAGREAARPGRFDAIIRELRASLEGLEELDPNRLYLLASELDAAIEEAAASRYISSALDDLGGQMARVRHYSRSDGERLARAAEEHIVIAEAILAGDELLSVSATTVHLRNSLATVLRSLPED
jgi:DNA-binding GntR family transcriptional regulator